MRINYFAEALCRIEKEDKIRFILTDNRITVKGWDLYAHKFYSTDKDGYIRRR